MLFWRMISCLCVSALVSATPALAQLRIADSVTENFNANRNLNFACGPDPAVTSDGDIDRLAGFCPLGNQPTYEVSYIFDAPSLNDVFDSITIWANAGNVYTDLELRQFDLSIDFLDGSGSLQTFIMNDVVIGNTLNDNDPQTVQFSDTAGQPVNLTGVSAIRLSDLRNMNNNGGEVPWRELQANVLEVIIDAVKTVEVFSASPAAEFALPGKDVIYTINIASSGAVPPDSGSLFLVDALPPEVVFFNGDIDGGGPETGVVAFDQSNTNITFSPSSDLAFSTASTPPASFADCTYSPMSGYDPAVRFICFAPKGNFDPAQPGGNFDLSFRARIE